MKQKKPDMKELALKIAWKVLKILRKDLFNKQDKKEKQDERAVQNNRGRNNNSSRNQEKAG